MPSLESPQQSSPPTESPDSGSNKAAAEIYLSTDRVPFHGIIENQLETLLFWTAIVLPFLYLPILVVGINTPEELLLFLGLFGLHVITLIGGRHHLEFSN